jgi:hypothetical protein
LIWIIEAEGFGVSLFGKKSRMSFVQKFFTAISSAAARSSRFVQEACNMHAKGGFHPRRSPMSHGDRKTAILQRIASDMLARIFPWGLSRSARTELRTSIVRQWQTYQGQAALFTDQCRYWFALTFKSQDQVDVSVSETPGPPLQAFLDDWKIDPDQSPEIIQRLNISQSAEFANRSGTRLRMWVDPKEHSLSIEPATDAATDGADAEVR